jgi:hypothetical protein
MNYFEAANQDFVDCMNEIANAETYVNVDRNKIELFLSKILHNPLYYFFVNEIYSSLAVKLYNEIILNISYYIECPCEIVKKMIYSYGIPPYYDEVKITSLIRKAVLKNNFCVCNKINCLSKPPMPDIIWFQNVLC